MRREFQLPHSDVLFLGSGGWEWETIVAGNVRWLLLHEFRIPSGYSVESATVALQVPLAYPDAQLDMVYFSPALTRKDGKPIGALAAQNIDGKSYQRWSRHRTSANPWRPGHDDVSTHVVLVNEWLTRELLK